MSIKRRRAAISAIMLVGATLSPLSAALECGYSEVTIAGTADEQAIACRALHSVAAYFDAIGYHIDPSIDQNTVARTQNFSRKETISFNR